MITWGISANSHNAALAVFVDEKLAFASETERFSGIKNDPHLNESIVEYARNRYGDPDQVCWYENPWLKTARQLWAGQGFQNNNVKRYLKKYDIFAPIKIQNHHHSHAAAGYHTSKFDDACIIVIDAIGEFECLTIWEGRAEKLKKKHSIKYPHSVGLWYSAMTQRCGLKPNEEEYILMGMAALGNPERLYKSILNDFIDSSSVFKLKQNLHRGCKDWRPDLISQQDIYDIAAATQAVYEMLLSNILMYSRRFTRSKNLVLMGGCALNCVANTIAAKIFDNMWIMPAPGDNGSAIGAVLAEHPSWRYSQIPFSPYLGHDMGQVNSNSEIVNYLLDHKICGLARGKAEFGPRALGNRSLIADPRGDNVKERVNAIKHREQFRPFAPAILAELASDYFDIPRGRDCDFMQHVYRCRRPDLFPAVVHFDGTSRVQTVPKDGSPFRLLLEEWHTRTGCPMLLNTSLNIKGQPMVNDIRDANAWESKYGVKVFN
jgi:carbamoyltransferase